MTSIFSIVYLVLLLVLGVWALRKSLHPQGYFLAGGQLGLIPAVLTTMASIISGFVFVGGPGLFYEVGLGSFWIVISGSFTGAMMCWVLAKPMLNLAKNGGCLTIPDVIQTKFRSRIAGGLAAFSIVVGVVGYLGTQIQALGYLLGGILGISTSEAALVGMAVIAFYSIGGGMLASVYTDVVQGLLMLWTTTLLFIFALQAGGGTGGIVDAIASTEPELLSPWGRVGAIGALSWFFLFAVGSLGQPHVVNKFMMIRDLSVLRFFPIVLAASMGLCSLIWLGIGSVVKKMVLVGELNPLISPDHAATQFLGSAVPGWLAAFAYIGIVAAIMSTSDSFACVGASALSRDLPRAIGLEVSRPVTWSRLGTMVLFVLAFLLSFWLRDLVAYLGILSFSIFAASLTPCLALGLWSESPSRRAGMFSIGAGLTSSLLMELLKRWGSLPLQLNPAVLSLAISFLVYLIVDYLSPGETKET